MHIAIDGSPLGTRQGGDETYLRGLLGALAECLEPEDGYQFTVHLRPDQPPLAPLVDHPDIAVRPLPPVSTPTRLVHTMPSVLRAASPQPDLLYSTVHAPVWSPVPVALQVHDLSFLHHPELFPAKTRLRLRALIGHQTPRARVVCTISEFSRADLIERYALDPDRVHVIPPAPPVVSTRARGARGDQLDRWLEDAGVRRPFLLSVGNLHPRKNLARLVEAYLLARSWSAAVRDHQLVICGQRRWGEDLERRAAESGVAASVVFLGRVCDQQRDHALRAASVLAYPSLFEGFGLPPLEAMSVGVPVLASDRGAIPEVVGDAALLVDPTKVADLALGIERLCVDGRLRSELIRNGHVRVEAFSAARTTAAALRAFGSVCTPADSGPRRPDPTSVP